MNSRHPAVQAENIALSKRVHDLDDTSRAAQRKIDLLEQRNKELEPDVSRLRHERVDWAAEKARLLSELDTARPIEKGFRELSNDLAGVAETVSVSNGLLSGIYDEGRASLEESSDNLLSQKHAIWIALPSLRQFSPILYDRIRGLAQDLHKKEMQCHDLKLLGQSLTKELDLARNEHRDEIAQLMQAKELSSRILDDNTAHMRDMESELVRLRTLRTTMDQIRLVLKSYPGNGDITMTDSTDCHQVREI